MTVSVPPSAIGSDGFAPTDWSLVLAAAQEEVSGPALNRLCHKYRRPLYLSVRRNGVPRSEAEDVTQEFLLYLLEKSWIKKADPEQGRFRAYLRTLLGNFLSNYRRGQRAQKRHGGLPDLSLDTDDCETEFAALSQSQVDPAKAFDRAWAHCILNEALTRLTCECEGAGLGGLINHLGPYLLQRPAEGDYPRLSRALGIGPVQVAKRVHKLRQRYRTLIRSELADTLANRGDVDAELRHLLLAVSY